MRFTILVIFVAFSLGPALLVAQEQPPATSSQALLPGANSSSESAALAYMRTVMRSEFLYKHKHKEFARSLASLIGSGSFTRRMARPDRGDYTVHYAGNGQSYQLTLVPTSFDDQHRSFFADQDGKIRVDAQQPASAQSPLLNTKK
jgi:hypothetical protein